MGDVKRQFVSMTGKEPVEAGGKFLTEILIRIIAQVRIDVRITKCHFQRFGNGRHQIVGKVPGHEIAPEHVSLTCQTVSRISIVIAIRQEFVILFGITRILDLFPMRLMLPGKPTILESRPDLDSINAEPAILSIVTSRALKATHVSTPTRRPSGTFADCRIPAD